MVRWPRLRSPDGLRQGRGRWRLGSSRCELGRRALGRFALRRLALLRRRTLRRRPLRRLELRLELGRAQRELLRARLRRLLLLGELLLLLRELAGAACNVDLTLGQLRDAGIEGSSPFVELLGGRGGRRRCDPRRQRLGLLLALRHLGDAAGKADLALGQLRHAGVEDGRPPVELGSRSLRLRPTRLGNRRERGAQLVELCRDLLLPGGDGRLPGGEALVGLGTAFLLQPREVGCATGEAELSLRQLGDPRIECRRPLIERLGGSSIGPRPRLPRRIGGGRDRSPQLVELRRDFLLAHGERRLADTELVPLRLERGDPLGDALLESLDEAVGHRTIIGCVLAGGTAAEASEQKDQRGNEADGKACKGAGGRKPRQLRPRGGRGRGRLAGMPDRRIRLALKALQNGEALLELDTRRGRALCLSGWHSAAAGRGGSSWPAGSGSSPSAA